MPVVAMLGFDSLRREKWNRYRNPQTKYQRKNCASRKSESPVKQQSRLRGIPLKVENYRWFSGAQCKHHIAISAAKPPP